MFYMNIIKETVGTPPFPWEYLHDPSITETFGKWLGFMTKSSSGHQSSPWMGFGLKNLRQEAGH